MPHSLTSVKLFCFLAIHVPLYSIMNMLAFLILLLGASALSSLFPRSPLLSRNASLDPSSGWSMSNGFLVRRHQCNNPRYSLCPNPDYCCPTGGICCNDGATGCARPGGACCSAGTGSCNEGLTCCEQGCAPEDHKCCTTGSMF
jgi:hypothetical protein